MTGDLLSYDEVLPRLLALIGKTVHVSFGGPDQPLVATLVGTLEAGFELSLPEMPETLYFCFAENRDNGFFLDSQKFDRAEYEQIPNVGRALMIVSGGMVIAIAETG